MMNARFNSRFHRLTFDTAFLTSTLSAQYRRAFYPGWSMFIADFIAVVTFTGRVLGKTVALSSLASTTNGRCSPGKAPAAILFPLLSDRAHGT